MSDDNILMGVAAAAVATVLLTGDGNPIRNECYRHAEINALEKE